MKSDSAKEDLGCVAGCINQKVFGCPLLEERRHASRLDKDSCIMVGKSSLGKKKKYEEEKCMLM